MWTWRIGVSPLTSSSPTPSSPPTLGRVYSWGSLPMIRSSSKLLGISVNSRLVYHLIANLCFNREFLLLKLKPNQGDNELNCVLDNALWVVLSSLISNEICRYIDVRRENKLVVNPFGQQQYIGTPFSQSFVIELFYEGEEQGMITREWVITGQSIISYRSCFSLLLYLI